MWTETPEGLYADFRFADFSEAFAFISRVALLAEKHDHHPTIVNTYNRVELSLCTHSAGNSITEKDRILAAAISALLQP